MCDCTLCALAFFYMQSTVGGRISWEATLHIVVNNSAVSGTAPKQDANLRKRIQLLANTRRPEKVAPVQSQAQLIAVFMAVLDGASEVRIRSVLAVLEDDELAQMAEPVLTIATKRLSLSSRHQLIALFECRVLKVDVAKRHA